MLHLLTDFSLYQGPAATRLVAPVALWGEGQLQPEAGRLHQCHSCHHPYLRHVSEHSIAALKGYVTRGLCSKLPIKDIYLTVHSHDELLCLMFREKKMVEINFLCVHKKLRSKRVAPVLIREITRRVNLQGIFQAVYTAGVVLPKPVGTCRWVCDKLCAQSLLSASGTNEQFLASQVLASLSEPTQTN